MKLKSSAALLLTAIGCGNVLWAQGTPASAPDDEALQRVLAEIESAMVPIPGGSFEMGDLSGRGFDDEKPAHAVTIHPFLMSKYEVTFEQFDMYALVSGKPHPSSHGQPRGRQPVVNVSHEDAREFIAWLNEQTGQSYRLPTEAEWEYAARAGTTTDYPWGSTFDKSMANGNGTDGDDTWPYTAPVGSFPANDWGLHDMIGNVWEWVADCYRHNYENAPTDGSATTTGMGWCKPVIRGGSWSNDPTNLRVSDRSWHDPTYRYYFMGFRLARDEQSP